ncbi:MAG: hypothetical protein AAF086_09720, partial [Planctomycetota bacterium]
MKLGQQTLIRGSIGVCLLVAGSASASVLMSDSFDYTLGSSIVGQSGGTGFGAAWTFDASGPGATEQIVDGLSIAGLASSGNALQITGGINDSRESGL